MVAYENHIFGNPSFSALWEESITLWEGSLLTCQPSNICLITFLLLVQPLFIYTLFIKVNNHHLKTYD